MSRRKSAIPKKQRYNKEFIRTVAKSYGVVRLTDKDAKRAHIAAAKYNDAQDYYDALKRFFLN